MPLAISAHSASRVPTTFVFDQVQVRLGRAHDNDMVFDPQVYGPTSRRHAILKHIEGGGWTVEDCGSTLGTYLNGKRITTATEMVSGDIVALGPEMPRLFIAWRDGSDSTYRKGPEGRIAEFSPFPLALHDEFLGKYHQYEKIGEGAYGQVWRARKHPGAAWVAIKLLRPELLSSGETPMSFRRVERLLLRFKREVDISQALTSHDAPGIARVFGAGADPDEGVFYMLMEFIEGHSMTDLILGHRLPDQEATLVRWVREVAEALDFAHNFDWTDPESGERMKGIIHRDVTPHNIMIRAQGGQAVLCDFGIAVFAEGGARLTLPTNRVSAQKFTPPEALAADVISKSSDLWGLAVTAYVLFSGGQFPYEPSTGESLLDCIRSGRMIPLRSHNRTVSAALDALITQGLDPDPAKRVPTARAWVEALWAMANVEGTNELVARLPYKA